MVHDRNKILKNHMFIVNSTIQRCQVYECDDNDVSKKLQIWSLAETKISKVIGGVFGKCALAASLYSSVIRYIECF